MRVLGIDPGLARTGVAVVDGSAGAMTLVHARCLETVPQTSEARRLSQLFHLVADVIKEYRPEVAAVETLFFSTNRQTAISVAQARGVIMCALGDAGIETAEYSPNQVKEAVAGSGNARKPQVARMAANLLRQSSIAGPDDTADACAIAICHHHRSRLGRSLIGSAKTGASPLDAAIAAAKARIDGGGR